MTTIHQPHGYLDAGKAKPKPIGSERGRYKPKGRFFGYLRVSTPKQGEGVSLLTQREEIARFAARKGFLIVGWFEEKETAAKRGRPVFRQLLPRLRKGEADGLIVHKVDRSARDLKDWADLGELIDRASRSPT